MTGKITHGHTRGRKISPEMMSWLAMRNRCHNPSNAKYPTYGARGISVCDRWRFSFALFFEDMGPRPAEMTLDRFPNKDGNYEPGNCRWATAIEQAENRDTRRLGWRREQTECPSGHPYNGENVAVRKDGSRRCRECDKSRARKIRALKKGVAP